MSMKTAMAGLLVLAGLAAAGVLASRAVGRDREYLRLILHGDEAMTKGQTFVAIEAYSGAIALKQGSMLAYLKRGEAHLSRGDTPATLTAALRDLRTAAELDPGATRTLEELGDVNFHLHRYDNAMDSYDAYLALDDRSAGVFYKLALASRSAGRLTRAVAAVQQALVLNPGLPEAHYVLGLCLKDRGQLVEARAAFDQAVRLAPAFIAPREELADLHRIQERRRAEIDELEALAALDPATPERRVAVGLAYLRARNLDSAVTTLRRAAERFPKNSAVYAALGRVWLDAAEDRADPSDLRKALEALEAAVTQAAATSEVLGLYGRALMLAGRYGQAEQMFRQASQRFPIDPDVLPRYATVAQRLGHLDEARQALARHSVLVDDDHRQEAAHAERIGDLSLQLHDAPAAVLWYKKSESLAPAGAALLARLADAQARAGDRETASATLRRAIEKDPDSPSVHAVARRLQIQTP